ncbi:hypothetical protein AB0F81_35025 [Actinoplanes sp. NPDC024001]|uniref:hypothetical protein n=1 Tax=Actinoplanes sp. NPDC024001 TaxID=3154598 RepID=UPI0033E4E4DA
MSAIAIVGLVTTLVTFFLLVELASAALPLLIIVTLVPPGQRQELAFLLATVDSSRRLRLWPALRAAVAARRRERWRYRTAF